MKFGYLAIGINKKDNKNYLFLSVIKPIDKKMFRYIVPKSIQRVVIFIPVLYF